MKQNHGGTQLAGSLELILSKLAFLKSPESATQEMVLPTVGWSFLHQLPIKTIPTDISAGQSYLGNTSTETPFSGDSGLRQADSEC